MTRRDPRAYVADMLRACEDIAGMVAGIEPEMFSADRMRQKAVVRDLEVLGEASRNLSEELRDLAPGVPWAKMVAMRNRLIHGYFGVDPDVVFRTAVEDVPSLMPGLRRLMVELERRSREGADDPAS